MFLSLCLTGLVCGYGGKQWSFMAQTSTLSVSAALLSWFGIKGARSRNKPLLVCSTLFGIWSLSAHVSYLYANTKLDRVGQLMCQEFKRHYRNSTIDPGNCKEASIEAGYWVSIAQSGFWFVAVVSLVCVVWNSFLLTGCLNETSRKLDRHMKHTSNSNSLPPVFNSLMPCCGKPPSNTEAGKSYLSHHSHHHQQHRDRDSHHHREGVLENVLSALEFSEMKQVNRTTALCAIQVGWREPQQYHKNAQIILVNNKKNIVDLTVIAFLVPISFARTLFLQPILVYTGLFGLGYSIRKCV
jgi:hypothetical protein